MYIVKYSEGFGAFQNKETRAKVEKLEKVIEEAPQADCPVKHYFAPGLYAREMSVKAGTVVTGAIHKVENLIVISKGTVKIVTNEGSETVSAPHTRTCYPGTKNAFYAVEDAVWTNFFATDETDPDKLVELLTESKANELIGQPKNKQLIANNKTIEGTSVELLEN